MVLRSSDPLLSVKVYFIDVYQRIVLVTRQEQPYPNKVILPDSAARLTRNGQRFNYWTIVEKPNINLLVETPLSAGLLRF